MAVSTPPQEQKKKAGPPARTDNKPRSAVYAPVALADSPVFVGHDEAGRMLRTFYRDLPLREKQHFMKISGKTMILAEGYKELNRIANVNILKPSTIIVDGIEKANPYFERNPDTGCVSLVYTRALGIGFAPTGNMVIVDKTLVFNLITYYIQDMQAKIKKFPSAGTWGVGTQKPLSWDAETEEGWGDNKKKIKHKDVKPNNPNTLYFIPVMPAGQTMTGMWVDFSHPDIQASLNEFFF